jgi:hypothetical protein
VALDLRAPHWRTVVSADIKSRLRLWTGSAATHPFSLHDAEDEVDQNQVASRIALRPHDPSTGDEIEREQVVKGYEYQRGQFVTFTPEELKALVGSLEPLALGPVCSELVTSDAPIGSPPSRRSPERLCGDPG